MPKSAQLVPPIIKARRYVAKRHITDRNIDVDLREISLLDLPNMYETTKTSDEIKSGEVKPSRAFGVTAPSPGRFTSREGKRLDRDELIPLIELWLEKASTNPLFVIQGGNRYISEYLRARDIIFNDIKVMSIDKAPLFNQMTTLLSTEERNEFLVIHDIENPSTLIRGRRIDLLKQFADNVPATPFKTPTRDEKLETELANAICLIQDEALDIPNLKIIIKILSNTGLGTILKTNDDLYFIDDLFYRGRTLYSLAIIINAFGGNPRKIKLFTLCCDLKSNELKSPYHIVMRPDILYPFENSIRTEQGYWHDDGDKHVFVDMGAYFEYLIIHIDIGLVRTDDIYKDWIDQLRVWFLPFWGKNEHIPLAESLMWLSIYHSGFNIIPNIDKIVDQKGYKIGACVPFAQLLDRFISQEEPVEERIRFKQTIRDIFTTIENAKLSDQNGYDLLVKAYLNNRGVLDYAGLSDLFIPHDDNDESAMIKVTTPDYLEYSEIISKKSETYEDK